MTKISRSNISGEGHPAQRYITVPDQVAERCRKVISEPSFCALPAGKQIQPLADLALLQHESDQQYFLHTFDRIQEIAQRLRTNHFGIREGKGRLLTLYLQLYRKSANTNYLELAIQLANELEENKFIRHKAVGDYSLYRGEAGQLLSLLLLSAHTPGKAAYRDRVERILLSILHGAWLSPEGIQWPPVVDSRQSLLGLGYGTAGIAYTLCLSMDDTSRQDVLTRIFAHEDSLFDSSSATWPDYLHVQDENVYRNYGFENGATGIAWVRLQAWKVLQAPDLLHKPLAVAEKLREKLADQNDAAVQLSLASGLTGFGHFFMELYHCTNDSQWSKIAGDIAEKITETLSEATILPGEISSFTEAVGFLSDFGRTGKGRGELVSPLPYMSHSISTDREGNVQLHTPSSGKLTAHWVEKDFPVTVSILQDHTPREYEDLLIQSRSQSMFGALQELVQSCTESEPYAEELLHQFSRERFVFLIKRQVDYKKMAEEELAIAEYTEALLRLPDAAFGKLTASHFPCVYTDSYEEPPANGRKFTAEEFSDFLLSYGSRTYLYRIFPEGEVRVFSIGIYKLVLDAFSEPCIITDGLQQAMTLFRNQAPEVLAIFSQYLEGELGITFDSEEEVFQTVYALLFQKVKEFVLGGILRVYGERDPGRKALPEYP
ncbi:MAG: lanthionine synthetase LanC family protein [Cyclobacteriaceae bacterium]